MIPKKASLFDVTSATKSVVKLDARGNLLELTTREYRILFSFGIPVAAEYKRHGTLYRTENPSLTRSMKRHITRWLEGREADWIQQALLEQLTGLV